MRTPFAWVAALLLLGAAAPSPIDSQVVLARYATALANLAPAKNVVFTYGVSQAGPHNIEQTHRIYRSGERVRDETLSIDGQGLKRKVTRIARYADRYAIERLAPRESEYTFLFLRATRDGARFRYTYEAIPAMKSAFVVRTVTIDGASYLPAKITFRTSNGSIDGAGEVDYARVGAHWVPTLAQVTATMNAKPARERIAFSAYAFPARLPPSTFAPPRPLPSLVHPKP